MQDASNFITVIVSGRKKNQMTGFHRLREEDNQLILSIVFNNRIPLFGAKQFKNIINHSQGGRDFIVSNNYYFSFTD